MPIPNISTLYQKINSGAEGGHEFARFIKLLLDAEYKSQRVNFIAESDASGDFKKVDAYIPGDKDLPNLITAFQFKSYPSKLSINQKSSIVKSIEDALIENEYIQDFILVTPEDFMKEQSAWFESLKKKYESNYWVSSNGLSRSAGLTLKHWGHSKIIELALKHDHIGTRYFPELFPVGVGKFKLSSSTISSIASAWYQSERHQNSFIQGVPEDLEVNMTSDPVFDFQFKNSTNEIHLLKRIEIHIIEICTTLQGIPKDQFLRSIGTIEFELDFEKDINTLEFPDPIIFEANSPKRFKIQLINFQEKCPGNHVEIKFWFYFDEITIPTDSFILTL